MMRIKAILSLLLLCTIIIVIPCYAGNNNGVVGVIARKNVAAVGDGFVGNSTNDSFYTIENADRLIYTVFTPDTSGNVGYIHCQTQYNDGNFLMVLCDSSGNLLAYASDNNPTENGWQNSALSSSIEISTGSTYILGVCSDSDTNYRTFRQTGSGEIRYVSLNYATPPSNFNTGDSAQLIDDCELKIVCDNQSGDPS